MAEDFKLATGTWVNVGPLRDAVIDHFAPLAQDVVIAGADRDAVGVLIFADLAACRRLAPDLAAAAPAALLRDPRVRGAFRRAPGRAGGRGDRQLEPRRPRAAAEEPPSIDRGEMTDKGSINQRAVLSHRAALVEALYATPPADFVIAL